MKHVLHHRRRLGQDADPGGDVDEQDAPQQVELSCLNGVIPADADVRDHGVRLRRACPSFRPPSWRRPAQESCADQHDHHVCGAERHHRPGNADAIHEIHVEIAGQERAAAESHDRHARRHAASIGKPLDQRAHGRDVTQPASDAADDSHADEHQDRLRASQAEPADKKPCPEEQRRRRGRGARTAAFDPGAAERGAEAEQHEGGRERRVRWAEPPG